jgi:single-stranded-DNA-specific exonuclease
VTADLATARRTLFAADWVVPHTDADGLAAGAAALRARGQTAADAVLLGRGETPFGDDPPLPEGSAAVLDWGVRPLARPGVVVDHHAPETEPRADQIVVSGYGEEPAVSTAVLVRRLLPETPAWLTAVGAFADLGDAAFALRECSRAPRTAVRTLVPLLNAARRAPAGPVRDALALLVEHDGPGSALRDSRIAVLARARDASRAAFRTAVRTPPIVRAEAALVRFASRYQVHPLVATAWSRRLAPRVVVAANDAYLPGRVNFAVRGGEGDLRALLRRAMPEARGEFAHGHDRATGGSLAPAEFEELVRRLGITA